jgi:hypothetical protein
MKGYIPKFVPCEVENCTCWFTCISDLKEHLHRDHDVKVVLV